VGDETVDGAKTSGRWSCGMVLMAMWQGLESDSISAGNTRLLMIFIGIVALSMLTQAIVVAFLAVGAKRTQARMLTIVEELRGRALPILGTAEDLLRETAPMVKTITENLLETSHVVRSKAHELDATLTEANQRAKAQMARVDGMVASGLNATGTLVELIHQGVRKPVLEISGLVNGFKAGLDVLLSKSKGFGVFGRGDRNSNS
jgi:hypothetical protein